LQRLKALSSRSTYGTTEEAAEKVATASAAPEGLLKLNG